MPRPPAGLPFPNWNRYRLLSALGAGGMGSVYLAEDRRLKRRVAIKFLRCGIDATDPRQLRRFEREARAQAAIDHPHICKIYEVGDVEGQPYIAMQLIAGSSLGGMQQAMTREEKVRAMKTVAEALHAAHSQGVIHRDIKPNNIMIERREDGTYWPYLMDFGIAREMHGASLSSTGHVEGTPAVMAPEQARGETAMLDERTDVYGLGATLYSILCGRPPFMGSTAEVLLAVMKEDPPRLRALDPACPAALEVIIQKCLEKDPRLRYHSAQALAEDLGRFLEGGRITARPPGVLRRVDKFVRRHALLSVSVATAFLACLVLGAVALRIRWQAAEQARLSQHLGQEISQMEWLLRCARQLPLHDLDREKIIIRRRMAELQSELTSYGPLRLGLAHYALGRGYMALREYPQALYHLEQALSLGEAGAEVHYALGFVLGKHYEKAMHEARLSGGGAWAQQQLQEIEPKYLRPAVGALLKSRGVRLDAPRFLEGLIAYYQRDYGAALRHAEAALREAPWLYEAHKLSGDVHLELSLAARESGRIEESDREFSGAVTSYETAAAMGQSDGEVYQGLAEAWLRKVETSVRLGQPAEAAYAQVAAASAKMTAVELRSTAAPLKKAFAAMLTMSLTGSRLATAERIKECLTASEAVLKWDPDNLYAREALANCYANAAEQARTRGEDPEPLWSRALQVLEETLQGSPRFLWGLNDLANFYVIRGGYRGLRGAASARTDLQRAIGYYTRAIELDKSYIIGWQNLLGALDELVLLTQSRQETRELVSSAEDAFWQCTSRNRSYQPCYVNYVIFYARLAKATLDAGEDPQAYLAPAREKLGRLMLLGGRYLDLEQHAALIHWLEAAAQVRRREDPEPALVQMRAALARCFALAAQDTVCLTLAAQQEWVRADWLAAQGKPFIPSLLAALDKAELATRATEPFPEAWLTVAKTRLRLARATDGQQALREPHLAEGLAAIERLFAINPSHPQGQATQRELQALTRPPQASTG